MSSIQANLLNDVKKGTFVDIGEVSGLRKIETPKTITHVNATYSEVDKIIQKSSRIQNVYNCYKGKFGEEGCMKDEVLCTGGKDFSRSIVQEHTSSVVDYNGKGSSRYVWKRCASEGQTCVIPAGETVLMSHSTYDPKYKKVSSNTECTWKGVGSTEKNFGSCFYMEAVNIKKLKVYCKAQYDNSGDDCTNGNGLCYGVPGGSCGTYRNGQWAQEHCNYKHKKRILDIKSGKMVNKDDWSYASAIINFSKTCDASTKRHTTTFGDQIIVVDSLSSSKISSCGPNERQYGEYCVSLKKCKVGYVADGKNKCYKNVSYKYYTYGCKAGNTVVDKGRTSCSKTDPDLTANSINYLKSNCNSENPPPQNCYKPSQGECPVDPGRKCVFKADTYKIEIPLRKFDFDENTTYKKWEYGRTRGWDCTTLGTNAIMNYNCQFGIRRVEANEGQICFIDTHNYKDCINYKDDSDCKITGSIGTGKDPIKDITVTDDGRGLYSKNITDPNADNLIKSECLFNGKVGFEDVGLGTIAVKAKQNRLIFWNSYNSKMVGFLDVLPKEVGNDKSQAITMFDFNRNGEKATIDVAAESESKEVLHFGDPASIVAGHSNNAIVILPDSKNIVWIDGGSDLKLKNLSQMSISFWIKPILFSAEETVIIKNANQISVVETPARKIIAKIKTSGSGEVEVQSKSALELKKWNYVTLTFSGNDIYLFVNNTQSSATATGKIDGENSPKFFVGSEADGSKKISAIIDDISISRKFRTESLHKATLSRTTTVSDYIGEKDKEIEGLLKNGFSSIYKSKDNHIYMASKKKLTSTECLNLISGTTFYIAKADANLDGYPNKNQVVVNEVLDGLCTDIRLNECENNASSKGCLDLNITTDSKNVGSLISELNKACEEAKLIRGLSKESFNNKYTTSSTKTYCEIESSDATPIDLLNVKYIEKSTKNIGNHLNQFVCSKYDCNSEHICGVAKCKDGDYGNIGVANGFTGCTSQSCDISKVYSPTCGSYTGCPEGVDIVKSSLKLATSNEKHVKVVSGGYDVNNNENSVSVNGLTISRLSGTWNLVIFNEDSTVNKILHFNTETSPQESRRMKLALNKITDKETFVVVTHGDPKENVSTNDELLNSMKDLGMNAHAIKNLEYRGIYIFVGKKNKPPIIEMERRRYSDRLEASFNLNSSASESKCYKIDCPTGSIFNGNTQTCDKIGCDEKSILEDGKCISTVVQ